MYYAYIVVFTPLHQMCALSRLRADGLSTVYGQVGGLACVCVFADHPSDAPEVVIVVEYSSCSRSIGVLV